MKCLDNGLGWLLYIFLAAFPSTVFFLVILFCKIRITSGPLNVVDVAELSNFDMSGSRGRAKCNSRIIFPTH